jgi:putative hemolysin
LDVPYAELFAVLGCVCLSVLFSGSETALNALGVKRLERVLDTLRQEKKQHRFLKIWATRRNEALTCILIGNNVVNILASALATDAFDQMFRGTEAAAFAIPTAVFVTTFLILTFGEIIPKTWAQNNAERFLPATRLLYPLFIVSKPLIKWFTWLSEWFIRKTGGHVHQVAMTVTEADIGENIAKAAEQGNLDEEQRRLLDGVMQFQETSVQEVMKPRTEVVGIGQDATLQDVLAIIAESNFSRYPVFDGDLDEVVGILYVRDLLPWFGRPQGAILEISDFIRKPLFVPAQKSIRDMLRELQDNRVHMAVVVDEFGGTAGVVTVEDIIEEVFGEIYDEYDDAHVGEDLVNLIETNVWEAEAKISVKDLEEAIGVSIECDSATVAGLVLEEVGSIPEPGHRIQYGELAFIVLERVEHHPEVDLSRLDQTG